MESLSSKPSSHVPSTQAQVLSTSLKIHHPFLQRYHSLYSHPSYKDLSPSISEKILPSHYILLACDPKASPSFQSTVTLLIPKTRLLNGYWTTMSLRRSVGSACSLAGLMLLEIGAKLTGISSHAQQTHQAAAPQKHGVLPRSESCFSLSPFSPPLSVWRSLISHQ